MYIYVYYNLKCHAHNHVWFFTPWRLVHGLFVTAELRAPRGMAFDAFGRTEDLARQAAATMLSTFVISGALSVPGRNGP